MIRESRTEEDSCVSTDRVKELMARVHAAGHTGNKDEIKNAQKELSELMPKMTQKQLEEIWK